MILKIRAHGRGRLSLKFISIFVIRNVCSCINSFRVGSKEKNCVGGVAKSFKPLVLMTKGKNEGVLRAALPCGGRVHECSV